MFLLLLSEYRILVFFVFCWLKGRFLVQLSVVVLFFFLSRAVCFRFKQ